MAGDDTLPVRTLRSAAIAFRDGAPSFAISRRAEIEARWHSAVAANPALFNGTVLVFEDMAVDGETLTATGRPVDYATFSAFIAWNGPDAGLVNLFGAAAIVSADGHLLLGRMGASTDDAGTIKLVGGTPDLSDVGADGVDLTGSIAREMEEETGLRAADATADPDLLFVFDHPYGAVAQVLRFPQSTDALVARIEAHLAAEADPELAGIVVVRTPGDDAVLTCPPYTRAIARFILPD